MNNAVNDPAPAPDNLFGNTGVSYNAAQLITFACHAVVNTVFVAPTPKPDWFDPLNTELVAAQTLAQQWIDTLGVQVTSTIPLQVINFGANYTAASAAIQQIVQANPTASGATNPAVVQIKEIIQLTLLPPIASVVSAMTGITTSLSTWGNALQVAHNNLASGATNIQSAETALTVDITKMTDAIKTLNDTITSENKAIAASAAAIGIGIFALVVGVALAPETGGASLLIGGAIGAAGIIGGGVTWGIMAHKISQQFNDIAADQNEQDDDNRQLIALQGLQLASNNCVSSIAMANQSLSKLQTQWGVFQGELTAVVSKLETAEEQIYTITQGVFTTAALTEWNDAVTTANNLANTRISIESQTLPMSSQQAA